MRDDLGRLVVRLGTGGLLLLHGIHKLLNGIEPIKALVTGRNLNELVAYGVYAGEIIGPILVVLGIFARVGASLILIDMIAAVVLARLGELLALGPQGGYALELELFYFLGAIAVILLGAGRYSIGASGRWN